MSYKFILSQPLSSDKLELITIRASTFESAFKYIQEQNPKSKIFSIDHNEKELIEYLKLHLSYLSPFCKYNNWTYLISFMKRNNNLYLTVGDFINDCKIPSTLFEWIRIIQNNGLDVSFIKERIDSIKSANFIIDDMTKIIRKDAVNSLKYDSSFRSKEKILTAVELEDVTCSNIIQELGQKYDLSKMITINRLEQEILQLTIHNKILKCLQENGFPKIGLEKQEHLENTNKNKWNITSIEKILTKIKDFDDVLVGYRNLHNVNEILNENNIRKKSKLIQEILLTKNDYIKYQKSKDLLELEQSKIKISLDDWQKDMINHIQLKHSLLVKGPTSGGKTFASMAAIDWLINTNGSVKLLYCAPIDHLCIQTWANISKTFEKQKVALICGIFAHVPENGKSVV